MDISVLIGLLIFSLIAGLIGSLLGLGGGIIIIPALTLIFGYEMQVAIGASLVGVIATSTGAATHYVHEKMVNIRLGMVLETATTTGSIIGALIAVYTDQSLLAIGFGIFLIYGAVYMVRRPERLSAKVMKSQKKLLRIKGNYLDKKLNQEISYEVENLDRGLAASTGAGIMSGLLGVGGGLVKVPVMNSWMNVPMKVATATSNFMIGVTALSGAIIYFGYGYLSPVLTGIVAVGVFFGATIGSRITHLLTGAGIRKFFAIVMMFIAILMFLRGTGVLVIG
ncbi:MAG: sulfite exporter TauE/SafE family protein [Methanomassiliicoccales archaeon]